MLSEEKELPYDRPMLTKNLFGAVSGGAIASVSAKWYQENRINLQLESRVAALDAEKKEVVLTDGTVYPFDKCIYALGAHSFVPPIKGNDLPQVAVVRSLQMWKESMRWCRTQKMPLSSAAACLGWRRLGSCVASVWMLRFWKAHLC